jgi:hypothetical protein
VYLAAVERLWGHEFVDGWRRPTPEQVLQHGPELLGDLEEALVKAEQSADPSAITS